MPFPFKVVRRQAQEVDKDYIRQGLQTTLKILSRLLRAVEDTEYI